MKYFLFAVIAFTAATCRVANALSRNSIRTPLPDSSPTTTYSHPHATLSTVNAINACSRCDSEEIASLSASKCKENDELKLNGASMQNRKQALFSISSAFVATTAGVLSSTISPSSSVAFDKTFPIELTDVDDKAKGVIIRPSNSQQRKQNAELSKKKMDQNLASFNIKNDLLPSLTWGLALFFASGSRSNPLATPLANILYDEKEEKWLEDRNAGLFSAPPLPLLFLLGFVFFIMGTLTQYILLQLSEGDSGVCGQLAGVSVIGGGFFEIGRIARYVYSNVM